MRRSLEAVTLIILALGLLAIISQAQAPIGSASIRAPAVIISNNTGSLTTITLTVYPGVGNVSVGGAQEIGNSTVQSAQTAAQYAATYLGLNYKDYNFNYTITGGGDNVSGPSGGTAMTLLAISVLSHKSLIKNFTVTGTISSLGAIGLIGGAYDKAAAAKANGMKFIIVPAAYGDSVEEELYLLTQNTFNIPVVQASNISQAYAYAFGVTPAASAETSVQLYNNYSVGKLSEAPLNCTNGCNAALFNQLVNFTFNFTGASMAALATTPSFSNVYQQFQASLAQNRALVAKGYLYAGADQTFLNYIDITYFNSNLINITTGFQALQATSAYCYSLHPSQLTVANYEYVIGGELRQAWGEYDANATLSSYNNSVETTDDVLSAMRQAAASSAWCNSAQEMYHIASVTGGMSMVQGGQLSSIASQRISRASTYGNSMYLTTAKAAFAVNNYPLAIIEADYAYALENATSVSSSASTGALINMSRALALNSTYGVWATQFSNEALFYVQEAQFANITATAHSYATSAYSSSLLASQLSADMATISLNLINGSGMPQINNQTRNTTTPITIINANSTISPVYISYLTDTTHQIFEIAVAMLAINIVLFFIVLYLLLPASKYSKGQLKRRRKRNSNG